jgi:hypothetical protein
MSRLPFIALAAIAVGAWLFCFGPNLPVLS